MSSQNDFHMHPPSYGHVVELSLLVSFSRTRPSSTSRRQARLRPRTSSRPQPSRPPPSRALLKPTAPLEPRGPPPAEVCSTVRTRDLPTRSLGSGPLGPPQALGCCSQSTRSVLGFYNTKKLVQCILGSKVTETSEYAPFANNDSTS